MLLKNCHTFVRSNNILKDLDEVKWTFYFPQINQQITLKFLIPNFRPIFNLYLDIVQQTANILNSTLQLARFGCNRICRSTSE